MPKFAWCHDGDQWHKEDQHGNEADTAEEAVGCCIRMMMDTDSHPTAEDIIDIGEVVTPTASSFVDADHIIDDIQCQAMDEGGECGEEWLEGFPKEHRDELKDLICKFLDEKCPVNFWTVKSITPHELTAEEIAAEVEE